MSSLAVFDVKHGAASSIRSLDDHCLNRTPDGWSAIDTERSHLNQTLVGADGPSASLKAWYERTNTRKAVGQAETPYFTLVLSASPEHLADPQKLSEWQRASIQFLKDEVGDELVWAELHLDETTPHIHALVVPTYEKMKRTPGRKRKGETDEAFEARKVAAAEGPGVRTVSRTQHKWSGLGSYEALRERYCAVTGLDFGHRGIMEDPKTTREWIKAQVKRFATMEVNFRAAMDAIRNRVGKLDRREAALNLREAALAARELALVEAKGELAKELIGTRRLYDKLLNAGKALHRNIGLDSLRPKQREKVASTLDDLGRTLSAADRDIKSASAVLDLSEDPDVQLGFRV